VPEFKAKSGALPTPQTGGVAPTCFDLFNGIWSEDGAGRIGFELTGIWWISVATKELR